MEQIFTVGDNTNHGEIMRFEIIQGRMYAHCKMGVFELSKIEIKQPKEEPKPLFDADKINTQIEKLDLAKEAFEAARLVHPLAGMKYDNFEDFINEYFKINKQ